MITLPTFVIFLDSGLQKKFYPLYKSMNFPTLGKNPPKSLVEALGMVESSTASATDEEKSFLFDLFETPLEGLGDDKKSLFSYQTSIQEKCVRYRFGRRHWSLPNGIQVDLHGIWVQIETNTSGQNANDGPVCFDRGYFYQKNALTEKEKEEFSADKNENRASRGGETHYVPMHEGQELDLDFPIAGLTNLKLPLAVRKPTSDPHDIDLVLDLGNTRSAGLLFEHLGKEVFSPEEFCAKFKVLRLAPDPDSGEYGDLGDVESGVADSWMVLHAMDSQAFRGRNAPKSPDFLQREFKELEFKQEGFLRKKWKLTGGYVVERVPQMFMQLSPVLIGRAAHQQFNDPYTRKLVALGHRIQQSSPKRYYWDDTPVESDWCMILNEWDPMRDDDPSDDVQAPTVQGEMYRFIRADGTLDPDLSREIPPHERPCPYPDKARYPRQSTLTWFLLHILERANSQSDGTFRSGADFRPHRLGKVLITYPSGWTSAEVDAYHARCKEALDIYSETHVYKGTKSPFRLEMVERKDSPDEAVAGQLPFVFSEIIRYPSQTAGDWIAAVGKKRGTETTVRILNFDIGGGTTDISIIEYKDRNPGGASGYTDLSTKLLFKDGQAIAGDDLLKKIVEEVILTPLAESRRGKPFSSGDDLGQHILDSFSQASTDPKITAQRSRIVRTCLIPLATYCLVHSGEKGLRFSAKKAGITVDNWNEFVVEFLGADDRAIAYDADLFSFEPSRLRTLMEETFLDLFRNCAMYTTAYDVDLLVFSGKTSEQECVRDMARRYLPISAERMIFARSFKPGDWYPFRDKDGYIQDAKTVTVVGAALYYALVNGLVRGWTLHRENSEEKTRNEWGEHTAIHRTVPVVALPKEMDEVTLPLLPNSHIDRRQNLCSTPEPVYLFRRVKGEDRNEPVRVTLRRVPDASGEKLEIAAVEGEDASNFELKLWPCADGLGPSFWQETGTFRNLG